MVIEKGKKKKKNLFKTQKQNFMQNNVIGSIELNRLKNRTLFSLVYFPLFSAGTTFDFLHPSSTETNQGSIQSSKFQYWLVVLPNETRRITKNFLPFMLVVAQATLSYPR